MGATTIAAIRDNLGSGLIELQAWGTSWLGVEDLLNLPTLNNGTPYNAWPGVVSVPPGTADLP